jgi:hypothetical protein
MGLIGRHDTQHNDIQHNDTQYKDTQHKRVICHIQQKRSLSITTRFHYAGCHYAEYHYTDCRYAECRGTPN